MVFVLMVVSLTLNAQPTLPIQSQDALRNYALASVTHGARWVNTESMDWNFSERLTDVSLQGDGAENVLDKLFNVEFVYRLTNPKDAISGYVVLYDKDNNTVFWGSAKYTAESLKDEKPNYAIWLQDVYLLENVQSAEVLALDEDGVTVRRYQLEVNQGRLRFQPWMSGAPNGLLAVRFNDGSLVTYQLSMPVASIPGGETEVESSWKIDGHHVVKTGDGPENRIVKIVEPWTRPTVFLTVTGTGVVTFDVLGLVQVNGVSFERPRELIFTRGSWTRTVLGNEDKPTEVGLRPGTYRVHFGWQLFGQPNTLYTGPDGGGGKG